MKKTIYLIIFIIFAIAIYLNRTYANIYNTIGKANLPAPAEKNYFFRSEDVCGERSGISPQQVKNNFSCEKIKIAFLGDSLTAGVGVNELAHTYPYLVAQKIANEQKKQVEVLNLGIPGATSADVLNNQVKLTNDFKPDEVYLFIGTNDMHNFVPLPKFYENLANILQGLNVKPVTMLNIPYLGSSKSFLPPYQTYFDWQTKKYNQIIKQVATDNNILYSNIYSQTISIFKKNKLFYANDNFHPNDEGYKMIAEAIDYQIE